MLAVFAVIVWSSPTARQQAETWALGVLLAVTLSIVLAGNVMVVNAIGAADWTDAQADSLGPGRPGYETGHGLAAIGMWSTVAATILLALVLLRRHLISRNQAIAATELREGVAKFTTQRRVGHLTNKIFYPCDASNPFPRGLRGIVGHRADPLDRWRRSGPKALYPRVLVDLSVTTFVGFDAAAPEVFPQR